MSAQEQPQDTDTDEKTDVLTFTLAEETYCVAIEYVAEIVDGGELTPLPEADDHVEGVMNLRGETTTIVNPFELLGAEATALITDGGRTENRIIVLDSDAVGTDSPVGWLVSDVREVKKHSHELLDTDVTGDSKFLRGLVMDENGFTLWVNPQELLT